jgi:hypothetical protein
MVDHDQSPDDDKISRLRGAMYSRALSEKIHARDRRKLAENRDVVGNDWNRPEPGTSPFMVAPRGIGTMRIFLSWLLVAAIVFFLGAAGFFAYYFSFGGGSISASSANIGIAISGPPHIAGGEPTELQVIVTNRNQIPLQLADLIITYPDGTRSPTDFATTLPNTRISLGTIEAGGERRGTVSAVFAGQAGARGTVKVELEYRLQGSNSIFVASSNYDFVFSSAPLSVAVSGNTETVSGQPVQIHIAVSSNAPTPVKDVLMQVNMPFGFTLSSSVPAATASGLWKLGDIAPGQTQQVLLNGTQSGAPGDDHIFRVTAGTRKNATSTSIDTPLSNATFAMHISQPFLGITTTVNNTTGTGVVVSPGDVVNVAINYANNLTSAITDAVIVARLSGIAIDGSTMRLTDGFYRSSDGSIIWNKTTTSGALASLAPGDKGVLQFSFQMPGSDALKSAHSPYLDITVNAAGNRVGESGVPETLQGTSQSRVSLASDVRIAANGLYYSNPFGSNGPMPPQAGVETTYAMVLTLTNTTNQVSSTVVRAVLPPYVRWTGVYSPASEKVTFNQHDSSVEWDVGNVAPNTGVNGSQPRQIAFSIGFTPSTSQIGQQPKLLENITLNGVDVATGASIVRTAADVTTNILGDKGFLPANANVVTKTE